MRSAWLIAAVVLCATAAFAQNSTPLTHYSLPPDKLAKATAFYNVRLRVYGFSLIYGFLVPIALLWWQIGPRFRNTAERVTRNVWLQGVVFALLLLLTIKVANFPLNLYRQHLGRAYGLVVQTWTSFFADYAKSTALMVAIEMSAIVFVYYLMRRFSRNWWLVTWAISVPLIIFVIFLTPLVIDPMFDHFDPLEAKQPQLVSEIEKVTQHGGLEIPRSRMFEMRASDKVTTLNAYVTGLGASKRVVVWDNTPKLLTIPQTLFVFGHEMGHYVLHHVWIGTAGAIAGLFVALLLAAKLANWAVGRWGERWQVRGVSDYASLPVFMLLVAALSLFGDPISSAYSRHLEHEADRYGIEVTHGIVADPQQTCAQSFQIMGENSLSYPWPNRLLVFWTYDHPAIPDRLKFCLEYDPWSNGLQPKYVK